MTFTQKNLKNQTRQACFHVVLLIDIINSIDIQLSMITIVFQVKRQVLTKSTHQLLVNRQLLIYLKSTEYSVTSLKTWVAVVSAIAWKLEGIGSI